jgi:hypothetical protein
MSPKPFFSLFCLSSRPAGLSLSFGREKALSLIEFCDLSVPAGYHIRTCLSLVIDTNGVIMMRSWYGIIRALANRVYLFACQFVLGGACIAAVGL